MNAVAPLDKKPFSRLQAAATNKPFHPFGESVRDFRVDATDAFAFHKRILYHKLARPCAADCGICRERGLGGATQAVACTLSNVSTTIAGGVPL